MNLHLAEAQLASDANFMTENLMIRKGVAVGIGNAPEKTAKNRESRSFDRFTAHLFTEPSIMGDLLAFLPLESLEPYIPKQDWSTHQTFSLYQRKPAPFEENASTAKVSDLIFDLCGSVNNTEDRKARIAKVKQRYPWLLYDGDARNPYLIHDLSKVM